MEGGHCVKWLDRVLSYLPSLLFGHRWLISEPVSLSDCLMPSFCHEGLPCNLTFAQGDISSGSQFLFPDSMLWLLHCYCSLQNCVNFCVYSYCGIILASTPHLLFNFMFKVSKIFDLAKYPILLLTVSTPSCWGSLVCVAVYQMDIFPWVEVRSCLECQDIDWI